MPPIIFLDIDGVLNCSGDRQQHMPLDPVKVDLLNTLVMATRANIVISSAWRLAHPMQQIQDTLRYCGLRHGRVIGITPDLEGMERGDEIQAWLDAQPEPPSRFCILDDDSDMAGLKRYLIRTQSSTGLTLDLVTKAMHILKSVSPS